MLAELDPSDWASWVVGEKGIYFVDRGPTRIEFVSFDSTAPTTIFTPPKQMPYHGRSLSLAADGRSLLFSMIDHSDDEIMTVDLAGL